MKPLCIAILSTAFLALQSCDDVTRDLVMRSSSRAILPLGPIRTPPVDTFTSLQANFSVSGMQGGNVPLALRKNSSGESTSGSDLVGPARLSISPFQASGALSLWFADRYRLGMGIEFGSTGAVGSLEAGLRYGGALSVEGYCGFGMAGVRSAVDWDLYTRYADGEGGNDTTHTFQSQDGEESHAFTRAGIHVARRAGGPWLELEVASQNLFIAPRSGIAWEADAFTAATGWAFHTSKGVVVVFGRGTNLGAGWVPSVGVQWSPDFSKR